MVFRTLLLGIFIGSCLPALAQLPYQLPGARTAGMGGAAVALPDLWALQHNIAALAEVQQVGVAAGYQTRLQLPELSTAGLVAAYPLKKGVVGASFSRYGFGAYSQQEVSLGYAHKINFVAVGIQAALVQVATTGFGSRMAPVLTLGGTADLHPKLRFGGYVYNATQTRINKEWNEYLPTLLRAGFLWRPTDHVRLVLSTEKDVDYPARWQAGVEYQPRPLLLLRTGIGTAPVVLCAGLGLWPVGKARQFRFDYALQHHQYLGLMHHLTFGWMWSNEP